MGHRPGARGLPPGRHSTGANGIEGGAVGHRPGARRLPPGRHSTGANGQGPGAVRHTGALLSAAENYCFHFSHDMFQPFSPLSGSTVRSSEFLTTTTSPTIEWLKNHAAGTFLSQPPRTSRRPMQPWLAL
ncbi:hypothetical protein SAMN06272771_5518 [Streptomyces sp. Ag82_O1-12]|nr:hypothetical protein SAMN06272771_5518 [Streptomyces sp. Ag82_O1-12]SOD48094.1 hypothetical protein SAMN06272727_5521 [Streptomyces sp. Ag82_G6-1]